MTPPSRSAASQLPDRTRGVAWPRDRASPAVLSAVSLAVLGVLASRASYVPIWDGFVYAEVINESARLLPTIPSLRLAGHASQAYAPVAIAVQALALNSRWPLFLLSVAPLGAAVVWFFRL